LKKKGVNLENIVLTYLPWLLSASTLWMAYLQGDMNKAAWVVGLVGLVGQLGWFVLTFVSGLYGLLPLNIGLTILYARNYLAWKDKERNE
jgi:cadmium resistance protein CadD (predicted permease)